MNEQTEYIIEKLRQKFSASEARELARWVEEEMTENPESIGISDAVERLLKGEPVQYVFQHALWLGLDLHVTPATLIPRPETAELVTLIGKRPAQTLRILDIGTGSGCIAIALKKDHPEWDVCGCDISTEALQVAQENAKRNNTEVKFYPCDILRNIPKGKYDVIVSNPPYVCESEKSTMESMVLDHEPASALFVSDTHPLLFYERISDVAKQLLTPNGMLYFEINERFGKETAELLHEHGFREIALRQDMFGKDRFVYGKR